MNQNVVLIFCCLLLFAWAESFSQNPRERILVYDSTVFQGRIVLIDGTELVGNVKYDRKEGLLSFKDEFEPRALQPEDVAFFEYTDKQSGEKKNFYSIEYKDKETGFKDFYFFEVLSELKDFAVVAMMDRIHVTSYGPAAPALNKDYQKMTQNETVFFLTPEMQLKPYLKIIEDETDWLVDVHYKANKILDKDLFKQFTGSYYPKLEVFAKENDLSFKRKKDIVTILIKYKEIAGE
jgi:hypothetical protein